MESSAKGNEVTEEQKAGLIQHDIERLELCKEVLRKWNLKKELKKKKK